MSIGSRVEKHKLNGSGGEFPKAGVFKKCKIEEVAVVKGKDNLESYIVTFSVGSWTPGKNVKGVRYPADTHTPGELVKFHQKMRPDIELTIINNIKNFCMGVLRQLFADKGKDPKEVKEESITAKVVDEMIFCANSRVVGIELDFNVAEEYTRNAKPDGSRGVVTKFTWLTRGGDGSSAALNADGSAAEPVEDETEEETEDGEEGTEGESESDPEPEPAPEPKKGTKGKK